MIDALQALRLQLEWGADETIGENAVDRFASKPTVQRLQPTLAPAAAPPPTPARTVQPAAPHATTLAALIAEMAAFDGCGLRTTAMQLVRPDGNPEARLAIIGDAPGSDEDRSGRAFSGATGALLDRVLATIGIDRRSALLTHLVPWRPPGNRRLTEQEIQTCLPFLHRLLGIVRPSHALLLGATPTRVLSGQDTPLRRVRGRWLRLEVQSEQLAIAALALPAPEQWLSNGSAKEQLWKDLITWHLGVTTA